MAKARHLWTHQQNVSCTEEGSLKKEKTQNPLVLKAPHSKEVHREAIILFMGLTVRPSRKQAIHYPSKYWAIIVYASSQEALLKAIAYRGLESIQIAELSPF